MKIDEHESEVVVELGEEKILRYDKNDWKGEENYLTSDGVIKLKEWKIDLIKNHGGDLDELQNKDN